MKPFADLGLETVLPPHPTTKYLPQKWGSFCANLRTYMKALTCTILYGATQECFTKPQVGAECFTKPQVSAECFTKPQVGAECFTEQHRLVQNVFKKPQAGAECFTSWYAMFYIATG
jgi:hypothetical protein